MAIFPVASLYAHNQQHFLIRVTPEAYIERHVNYVQYLNQRLMQAIERILHSHEQQVIILVTSDHGPGSSCEADNLLKPAYLRERTAHLMALYLPDRERDSPRCMSY